MLPSKEQDSFYTSVPLDAENGLGKGHVTGSDVSSSSSSEKGEGGGEQVDRGTWSRKMDFVLSCLSYAVGLGNVWRFPYICARNGGGAFLIPFLIMLLATGLPLVFMEMSFGQYASSGVVSIWKVAPLFQGVGWAMFIVSALIAVYYNMIIAWTLYYLFASFATVLPWSVCGEWSTPGCLQDRSGINNCTLHDGVWHNGSCVTRDSIPEAEFSLLGNQTTAHDHHSPSVDYFHRVVLEMTSGVDDLGTVRWSLALCLLLAWLVVCLCLAKGIKTSGKAVYFTAFFPYLVLTILLVRGLTLEGAMDGILYFLLPDWHQLLKAQVWGDAAVQIFFSLSPCWGGLITLSSYSSFHNNCFMDAVLVSVMDCLTSVYAGLVIFAIIGHMAHDLHTGVGEVATEGAGLAFVVYPEVVTRLPVSQLWSVLFFAMLLTLGLGTQIATVTTVHTTLLDQFPRLFRKGKRALLLLLVISLLSYLVGLAFCTQGGMFILQLFDNYAATYSLLFIGSVECLALGWVYGAERFLDNVELMLGQRPSKIWLLAWKYVAPFALAVILIFTCVNFSPTCYGDYTFPPWADGLGLLLTLTSCLAIPVTAVFKVVLEQRQSEDSTLECVKRLMRPRQSWGPALKVHRQEEEAAADDVTPAAFESQIPLTAKS